MNRNPPRSENLLMNLTKGLSSLSVLLEQLDKSAITEEIRNVKANASKKNYSYNEVTERIPEYPKMNKGNPFDLRVWCPVMCRLDGECCLAGRILFNEEWVLYRTNYVKSVTNNGRLVCDDDDNWFRLCGGLVPTTQEECHAKDQTIPLVQFNWKIVDAFSDGLPDNFRIWIQKVAVATDRSERRIEPAAVPASPAKSNCDLDTSSASSQSGEPKDEHDGLFESQVSESFADFDVNEDPVKYVDRLLANNPYKEIFRDRMIDRVMSFKKKLLSKMDRKENEKLRGDEENVAPETETFEPQVSESPSDKKSRRGRPRQERRSFSDQRPEESQPSPSGRLTGRPVVSNPRRRLKNSKVTAKSKANGENEKPSGDEENVAPETETFEPQVSTSPSDKKSRRGRPRQKSRSFSDQRPEESQPSTSDRLTGKALNPRRRLKNSKVTAKSKAKVSERKGREESEEAPMSGVIIHDFSPQDEISPFCLRTISGSNVDVRNLPRSRSGRIIKPILDNFRGQYITIKDGKVTEIHHGKEDVVYNLNMFSAVYSAGRPKKSQPKVRIQPSMVRGSGKRKLFSADASPPLPSSSFDDSCAKRKSRILGRM